jgi:hypothetical protein
MSDENIDWFALVIRKAWEDMPEQAQPKEILALETLSHCRRQQLIRMAASRGGTLKLDDTYEWVCTSTIVGIDMDTIVQGYYHIIPTDEKREYGELHLRNLHDNYNIVVENNTAKGERHDLPLVLELDVSFNDCRRWRSRSHQRRVPITSRSISFPIGRRTTWIRYPKPPHCARKRSCHRRATLIPERNR